MDRGIDRIGPERLVRGAPSPRVRRRSEEEREAFRRALDHQPEAPEEEPVSADTPELGDREPDEAGGRLDLLG